MMSTVKRNTRAFSLCQPRFLTFAVFASMFILSGCVIQQAPQPNDPLYAPVMAPSAQQDLPRNGSLYSDNNEMDLFSDRKARRVGDILTVVLQEKTVSKKSSNVEVTKESEVDIPNVAGAAGTLFLMFFAPARLVHGGTIILWVGASSAMALFLMQAELATLDKLRDYSKLNEMLGSIRIPSFSNPVISIAEELDLPEISRFSNGRVPQPTADQQMEFERLILQ